MPADTLFEQQDDSQVVDLLHPRPMRRIDPAAAELALVMAFAGGTSAGLFSDLLSRARTAPSSFHPKAYAEDLFVKNFVVECFRPEIDSASPQLCNEHLLRLLLQPPLDRNTVDFRRHIVWELMHQPALKHELQGLYSALNRLRSGLEGSGVVGAEVGHRRQLRILEALSEVIERMATGFESAASGLRRIRAFGQRVRESEPFISLQHLLQYDEGLAAVDFRVGIGADGRVRKLELLQVNEAKDNTFVSPPWQRWLAKLELFGRGFSFSDGEVLARLLDAIFDGVGPEVLPLVELYGAIEFYLGALGFCQRAQAAGLEVCLPELIAADQPREMLGLFNPLLMSRCVPVPCDIRLDRNDSTVLITGPNSGGKTRLLQSLGLAQLLAQAGLYVPARSAKMALAPGLVVSLIQETTVDQTEGRLGMELIRIRGLFEQLPRGAMVILDELCSGTNPSEGEEIFELVLRMLELLRPQAFITTHFLDFASRLEKRRQIDGLRFLQVALGPKLEPTYQFSHGVAETSLASHAAQRLGVTGEQLLALIEQNLGA